MSIWEYIIHGGIMMYPIFIISIITVAVAVERWRYYGKITMDCQGFCDKMVDLLMKKDYKGVQELCDKADNPITDVIKSGIVHAAIGLNQREIITSAAHLAAKKIKSYLNYLAVIVTMAPLLGLLGTVVGMIQSFKVFDLAAGEPMAITGGIGEALVATATGLVVAVMALIFHTVLIHKANQLIGQVEFLATNYLAVMEGPNNDH